MTRFILPLLVVLSAYLMGTATGMLLGWTGVVEKPAFIKGPPSAPLSAQDAKRKAIEDWKTEMEYFTMKLNQAVLNKGKEKISIP